MLHTISWSVFLMSLTCLFLAYWLFIGIFYYSRDLKSLIAGKSRVKPGLQNGSGNAMFFRTDELYGSNQSDSRASKEISKDGKSAEDSRNTTLFPVAYRLVDELKETIHESAKKKAAREELFYAIQIILNQEAYTKLNHTPFKIAINNLIETECRSVAGITIESDELNILWEK